MKKNATKVIIIPIAIIVLIVAAILVLALLDFTHQHTGAGITKLVIAALLMAFIFGSVRLFEKLPLATSGTIFILVFLVVMSCFFLADSRNDLKSDLTHPQPVAGDPDNPGVPDEGLAKSGQMEGLTECAAGSTGHDKCGAHCDCVPGVNPSWSCDRDPCGTITPDN